MIASDSNPSSSSCGYVVSILGAAPVCGVGMLMLCFAAETEQNLMKTGASAGDIRVSIIP